MNWTAEEQETQDKSGSALTMCLGGDLLRNVQLACDYFVLYNTKTVQLLVGVWNNQLSLPHR